VRKASKVMGCLWGIGKRKWIGDDRRRMIMFESMIKYIDIWYSDLRMERIRRGRESARKKFERSVKSG
jgi:hypothetical protein